MEWFITVVTEMFVSTRAVGKASRAQVECIILLMMSSTSCCETKGKQWTDWEIPDCGSKVRIGRVERQPDRTARMESIFELKKANEIIAMSFCSFYVRGCLWLEEMVNGE